MQHTIRIEKIIHGGMGLGRLADGIVAMCPHALPGETVRIRETRRRRGHVEAELLEVVTPSPDRVDPPCPRYGECGGCDFQHMTMEAQLRAKTGIVRECFSRAGIRRADLVTAQAVPSPRSFHYRNRLRLKLSPDGEPGLYRAGSNTVVPLSSCPVASERVNTALAALSSSPLLRPLAGRITECELLHSPADDRVFCLLHPVHGGRKPDPETMKALAELPALAGGVSASPGAGGASRTDFSADHLLRQEFPPELCGKSFSLTWSPGCFSQVNALQNERLVSLVCDMAGDCRGKKTLDLYCGMGNFSVPLALRGAEVTGVEQHQRAIAHARQNCRAGGIRDASFVAADAVAWLRRAVRKRHHFDLVLLDPPRRGMGKAASLISQLEPEKIICISCDPATLARDVRRLTGEGYQPARIVPVDMFPQTHHIETVVLLEKN
ncbi:MAG: 23S rRNA (uracil(1939)-C(5))-methyltransferase RlmD [Desulfobulbaceae bacterium]